jgi:hypothetical protein
MRMARVNITIPDELLERARAAGVNVSRAAASALSEELDVALGPVSPEDEAAAREWADRAFGPLAADVPAQRAS